MNKSPLQRYKLFLLFILQSSSLILCLTGCQDNITPKSELKSKPITMYTGLAGKSVGVMVWADRGIKIDWNSIQFDLANHVQELLSTQKKKEELEGTTWPVKPASIVRYQRDHPGIDALPITEIAPKLGVQRLIYIEIDSFATRSEATVQMYRGNATVDLKVIEVDLHGQAKVTYEEREIRATFPPHAPPEGVTNQTDSVIYQGEVAALAQNIARRFVKFDE